MCQFKLTKVQRPGLGKEQGRNNRAVEGGGGGGLVRAERGSGYNFQFDSVKHCRFPPVVTLDQ